MTLLIPEDLRAEVVQYLAGRPWREVANLMPRLLTLASAPAAAGEGMAGTDPNEKPKE